MDWGKLKDSLTVLVLSVILFSSDYIMDVLNVREQRRKGNHEWANLILCFIFTTHVIAASSDLRDAYYENRFV